MDTKKFTQFGTLSVLIMLPMLIIFTRMMIKSGLKNGPDFYVFVFLSVTLLICLLLFYQLTITVSSTHVSFKLGVGLIRKTYKISDISTCRPVVNSPLYGVGIRMIPGGWLFNVTGIDAIELRFRNKASVVRIGTNKPEEISRLIHSIIGGNTANDTSDKPTKKWINPLWIVVVLLILSLTIIPNYIGTKVQVDQSGLRVRGIYGLTIPYADFVQIDTVSSLPGISLRTNGYSFGKTLIGNFKFADGRQVKLFVKKGVAPYLLIKSKGEVPIYINFENKQETIDLYNKLKIKE